jgi:hypothetical protein
VFHLSVTSCGQRGNDSGVPGCRINRHLQHPRLFWTIPSAYLQGSAAAGGIALICAIGSFGGAVCPAFVGWLTVKTGSLYGALAAIGALHAAGMVTLLIWAPRGIGQGEAAGKACVAQPNKAGAVR